MEWTNKLIVNVIVVFDKKANKMLMCKRRKDPYKGKFNMVGGKRKKGESPENAAYRELFEETGITKNDINLTHVMDFNYYLEECLVEVFFGQLNDEFTVYGDENELFWLDIYKENYFDSLRFAGEGNIGHILEIILLYKDKLDIRFN